MNFVRSKVVAIVLALSMVFSVLAMPVVNAEEVTTQKTAADAAQFLQDNSLLLGDESGDLGLGNSLTRAEMMVVMARLMQQEEAAAGFATEGLAFTDVTGWAAPYVAWAVDAGITKGTSENTFSPDQKVTGKEAKAFFLRALGYDVAWEEIVTKADELGISNAEVEVTVADDQPILRSDMATMMYNTVYTETEDGSGLLGEQLGVVAPAEENAVPVLSDVKASAEVTAADSVDVTGKVEPATATVKVGTVDATVAEDGTFKATVTLDKAATDGVNNFDVVATNVDQTASETVKVTYSGALEVSKAVVVSDTAIKVTFNRAVLDTTKIKFDITGASVLAPVATWNDAKTEALLTNPSIILEGAYTVKVSGDTFAAGKDSVSLVVVKNGIAKIEIVGDKLVRTGAKTAQFSFKLADKYGNDVTESLSYDLSMVTSVGTCSIKDIKTGLVELTKGAAEAAWLDNQVSPEIVAVTLIAKTTAVSGNAVLKVTELSKVDSVTLGAVVYPTTSPATTKVLMNKLAAAYVPLDAVDQYGTVIKDEVKLSPTDAASQVFYALSDNTLKLRSETYTDAATNTDKVRLVVDTTGFTNLTTDKIVTVTAISKASGKSAALTLTIKKGAAPDKVTLLSPETMVAAGDTKDEALVIPMVVLDQDGKQLSPDEVVDNASKFTFSGTFLVQTGTPGAYVDAANTNASLKIATTGVNKGKIVSTGNRIKELAGTNGSGTASIIVTVTGATSGVASTTLDLKEIAYPRTVKLDVTPAQNLLTGSVTKYNYQLVDQYGRKMEKEQLTVLGTDYKVKMTLTNPEYVSLVGFTVPTQTVNSSAIVDKDVMQVTGGAIAGTSRIKAELLDKAPAVSVVSSVETSFNVVEGVPSGLTYEIADVPTLYGIYNGDYDKAATATSQYGRALSIVGKDASGTTYAVPMSRVLSAVSTDSTVADLSILRDATAAINAQDNAITVYGNTTAFQPGDANSTTKTATIKVTIGTDNGPKEVTKTVTVAKDPAVPVKALFVDTAIAATNPYKLVDDTKEITEIYGDLATIAGKDIYVVALDQYGVYNNVSNAAPIALSVVNSDKCKATVTITAKRITGLTAVNTVKDTNIILMFPAGGVYATMNIKSSEGTTSELVAPTADIVAPIVVGDTNANHALAAGETITIKFSEALKTNSFVIGDITIGGGTTLDTSTIATTDNRTFVITLAGTPTVVATNTFTLAAAKVVDANGNPAAAPVVFTIPAF